MDYNKIPQLQIEKKILQSKIRELTLQIQIIIIGMKKM